MLTLDPWGRSGNDQVVKSAGNAEELSHTWLGCHPGRRASPKNTQLSGRLPEPVSCHDAKDPPNC